MSVAAGSGFSRRTIGRGLLCPPCNIGPLSTPDYGTLAGQAVHDLGRGITVFAGQRAEAFYVDLGSILLTGIPSGIVPGFQNYTGPVQADMLRLNTSVKPAKSPNPLGLVAGDAAGFPNGRRPIDDVVTVELRALAGLTYQLVDKKYKPDTVVNSVTDGLTGASVASPPTGHFPYLGTPYDGYSNPSS